MRHEDTARITPGFYSAANRAFRDTRGRPRSPAGRSDGQARQTSGRFGKITVGCM